MPCNPAYARLLREPATGEMLLHYTRTSMDGDHSRTFLYHLVPRHNLLINGDLWMCTSEAWWRFPIGNTNLVVYRLPRQSADDGCFLATNCGAPSCTPGQSVYQDVPLAGVRARRLAFGGVLASEGGPATVTVALFQLSAEGAVLTNSALAVSLGGSTYQPARQEVVLLPNAATLRFQLYLQDPATLHADRMFIEVLD
ncbi:MAG: hypothetical protein IPG96_12605 [Proteobacteria bacterium]|nr:hypothetical protein [Pseudomonadota bacterium]